MKKISNILILKITSFISSMFPLIVFLLLKYYNKFSFYKHKKSIVSPHQIVIFLFVIEMLSVIYVIIYYKVIIKSRGFKRYNNIILVHLTNLQQEKINTSNYLLANVLPIISLQYDNFANVFFVIFIIMFLAFMYIKNNLYYINPLYDLLNIKAYNSKITKINNDNTTKELNKIIISTIDLYEFTNNEYDAIENFDNIIVIKEV